MTLVVEARSIPVHERVAWSGGGVEQVGIEDPDVVVVEDILRLGPKAVDIFARNWQFSGESSFLGWEQRRRIRPVHAPSIVTRITE